MGLLDEPSRKPLPQAQREDVMRSAAKGMVSMIPFAGGPASELIGLLSSPLAERRDDWLTDLERRLRDLENTVEDFRFEDLANNQQFISATIQAMRTALGTHDKEKLAALSNAVLNAAIDNDHDDYHEIFLSLVDRLSPAHLRILGGLGSPDPPRYKAWRDSPTKAITESHNPVEWIKHLIPALALADNSFVRMLIDDLQRSDLITPRGDGPAPPHPFWLTEFGKAFVKYISGPSSGRPSHRA